MSARESTAHRRLPSVDRILRSPALQEIVDTWGLATATHAVRELLSEARASENVAEWVFHTEDYGLHVDAWLDHNRSPGYQTVFNLTGTLLHTNLGRAALDESLLLRASKSALRPTALEYDTKGGRRGDRERPIRERLSLLCQSESATVVNNNAAAVLLLLNTLARDREVLISRGELIEIGGSFRLPEIMERAGCRLVEVGTTNRTRIEDFDRAFTTDTALLLKVHPSNYRIEGFTQSVSVRELGEFADERGVPFAVDLGSGALVKLEKFGLEHEPRPQEVLQQGADVVTFSGDKLLGGPQAGLIVGNSESIDAMNSNPLKRALRLDKLTLALLNETLKAYEDIESVHNHVAFLGSLKVTEKELRQRAEQIVSTLHELSPGYELDIGDSDAEIGSGALPGKSVSSVAVLISDKGDSSSNVRNLESRLRNLRPAVLGRIHRGVLRLDMRGADPIDELIDTLRQLQ